MLSIAAIPTLTYPEAGRAVLRLAATVSDTDPFITSLGYTVDWGDGSHITLNRQANPTLLSQERLYVPGSYVATLTVRNYRTTPQSVQYRYAFSVQAPSTGPVAGSSPVIFGPIAPRQSGFPNESQWNFNLGSDAILIESSLRMILLTEKGERVMNPDFGVSLRRFVFSPNTADLESDVRQEITQAVARYEPRATLQDLSLSRQGRQLDVQADFTTTIDQNTLTITLGLSGT